MANFPREVRVMKISARNMLKGKVKEISRGAVNSEVIVSIAPGVDIVSIITNHSVENLNLAKGSDVYAVIKASSVIIAAD